MNEERDLLIQAGRRIRAADRGQLTAGVVVLLTAIALVVLFDPQVTGEGELSLVAWLVSRALLGVVFAIGVGLIAASMRPSRVPGRRSTPYVVATSIPFLGGLISWLTRRHDNELVNPEIVSESDDDPFVVKHR